MGMMGEVSGSGRIRYNYPFTTLTALPSTNAFKLPAAMLISRWRASNVAHAMCGVIWQLRAVSSGLSGAGGSVESTSTAAAAICPLLSASASACSSMSGPRPVFISIAVGFICASAAAFIKWRVLSDSGQCRLTISLCRHKSLYDTLLKPSGKFVLLVTAITFIPKAKAMRAVAIPVLPSPTRPMVLPASSTCGRSQKQKSMLRDHAPLRTSCEWCST